MRRRSAINAAIVVAAAGILPFIYEELAQQSEEPGRLNNGQAPATPGPGQYGVLFHETVDSLGLQSVDACSSATPCATPTPTPTPVKTPVPTPTPAPKTPTPTPVRTPTPPPAGGGSTPTPVPTATPAPGRGGAGTPTPTTVAGNQGSGGGTGGGGAAAAGQAGPSNVGSPVAEDTTTSAGTNTPPPGVVSNQTSGARTAAATATNTNTLIAAVTRSWPAVTLTTIVLAGLTGLWWVKRDVLVRWRRGGLGRLKLVTEFGLAVFFVALALLFALGW